MKHKIVLLGCTLSLIPLAAFAQPYWTYQKARNALTVEVMKSSYVGGTSFSFPTSISYISGRFSLSSGTMVEAELPITHLGFKRQKIQSETGIGNPYLGLRFSGASRFEGRLGVRAPLASSYNYRVLEWASFTDYERFEAYYPDYMSATASFGMTHPIAESIAVNWGIGPTVMVNTGTSDAKGDNVEILAQYRARAEFMSQALTLGLGLTGRRFMTVPRDNLLDEVIHQLTLSGVAHFKGVHPGLYLRVPLSEAMHRLNYSLGFNVTFDLAGK